MGKGGIEDGSGGIVMKRFEGKSSGKVEDWLAMGSKCGGGAWFLQSRTRLKDEFKVSSWWFEVRWQWWVCLEAGGIDGWVWSLKSVMGSKFGGGACLRHGRRLDLIENGFWLKVKRRILNDWGREDKRDWENSFLFIILAFERRSQCRSPIVVVIRVSE